MVKRRVKPGRTRASGSPSRRSRRTQNEWNVESVGVESRRASASNAATRSRISAAALLVNVTARMADGGTRRSVTICAMRWVMTRVFPLPAPARISSGPSVWLTASRCCGLSPLRKSMGSRLLKCSKGRAKAGRRDSICRGRRFVLVPSPYDNQNCFAMPACFNTAFAVCRDRIFWSTGKRRCVIGLNQISWSPRPAAQSNIRAPEEGPSLSVSN